MPIPADPRTPSPRPSGVAVVITCTATAGLLGSAWWAIGPDYPAFAVVVHFALMSAAAIGLGGWTGRAEARWWRVTPAELTMYRYLGVHRFGRLLDAIGWTRVVKRMRSFEGTRAGLSALDLDTRRSELGHLLCAAVALALIVATAAVGAWTGAVWLAALTIPLHAYPAMLQRVVRARIQRIVSL